MKSSKVMREVRNHLEDLLLFVNQTTEASFSLNHSLNQASHLHRRYLSHSEYRQHSFLTPPMTNVNQSFDLRKQKRKRAKKNVQMELFQRFMKYEDDDQVDPRPPRQL